MRRLRRQETPPAQKENRRGNRGFSLHEEFSSKQCRQIRKNRRQNPREGRARRGRRCQSRCRQPPRVPEQQFRPGAPSGGQGEAGAARRCPAQDPAQAPAAAFARGGAVNGIAWGGCGCVAGFAGSPDRAREGRVNRQLGAVVEGEPLRQYFDLAPTEEGSEPLRRPWL
eukprot:s5800_g2.t1